MLGIAGLSADGIGLVSMGVARRVESGSFMQDSRVIEVDGVFVGAAVALPDAKGWRIVAADQRVGKIDGLVTASIGEAQRLAKQAILAWRPALAVVN
jgi:hypothetical protein